MLLCATYLALIIAKMDAGKMIILMYFCMA